MAETPTVSFRVPAWMLDQLRKRAETERRTIGALIRVLLEKQLANGGGR